MKNYEVQHKLSIFVAAAVVWQVMIRLKCLRQQRQDGDAGVAAHDRHVHILHIQALALGVECLGTHLRTHRQERLSS